MNVFINYFFLSTAFFYVYFLLLPTIVLSRHLVAPPLLLPFDFPLHWSLYLLLLILFPPAKTQLKCILEKKTHFRIRSSALTKKRRYRWISWTLRGSEMNVTNRALIIKSGLIRKDQNLKLLYCIIYRVISEDWDDQKYVNW